MIKMISYFDANGTFISSGTATIVKEGLPFIERLPPNAFGSINYEVDIFSQYYDIAESKVKDIPTTPSKFHVFNLFTKVWLDPRTTEDFQNQKWEEIKAARFAARETPLITPYGIFDAKEKDQINIKDTVALANNLTAMGYPVAIKFTLYNNKILVMNALMIIQVGLMLDARMQAARNKATLLRDLIFSVNITTAELAAINWTENV